MSVAGMEEKIVVESWIFLRAFEDHPSFALFFFLYVIVIYLGDEMTPSAFTKFSF